LCLRDLRTEEQTDKVIPIYLPKLSLWGISNKSSHGLTTSKDKQQRQEYEGNWSL